MRFSLNCFCLTLLLLSPASWALETDRQQPIHIQADRITVHEKEGRSYYEGNVEFTQGSLQIKGDEITVHLQNDALQKIIVKGTPATLQQRPEADHELVHSKALRMEYDAIQQVVTLIENAQVQQGPDVRRYRGGGLLVKSQCLVVVPPPIVFHGQAEQRAGMGAVGFDCPLVESDDLVRVATQDGHRMPAGWLYNLDKEKMLILVVAAVLC